MASNLNAIERVDITTLIEQVGAKLDVLIDAGSTPSIDQTTVWLLNGAIYMATTLPPPMVQSLVAREEVVLSAGYGAVPTDMLRIFGVEVSSVPAQIVTEQEFFAIIARAPKLYTYASPLATICAVSGARSVRTHPDTGFATLTAVIVPSDATHWPDGYSPPLDWESFLVDYALIQGKIQDEEPQQVTLLLQAWYAAVQQYGAGEYKGAEIGSGA